MVFDMIPRQVDEVDSSIVELLLENGRRSASEIGRRVGMSPASAKRRIDRLEAIGVITGYRAIIDYQTLGDQIEAFTEVRFAGSTQVGDIDRTYSELPEVVEAFTVAGDPDALVRLRVRKLDHLKDVVATIRGSGRVTGTKTLIVLGSLSGRT